MKKIVCIVLFLVCTSNAILPPAATGPERYWQVEYTKVNSTEYFFSVIFEPHEGFVDSDNFTRIQFKKFTPLFGGPQLSDTVYEFSLGATWQETGNQVYDINDPAHRELLEHVMDAFYVDELTSIHMDSFPWDLITDPYFWEDSDGDGVGNIQDIDADNDGWASWFEHELGLDASDPNTMPLDSDDDGWADSVEVEFGSDPLNPYFHPDTNFNTNPFGPSMGSGGYDGLGSYTLGESPEGPSGTSPVVTQTGVQIFVLSNLLSLAMGAMIGAVIAVTLGIFMIRRGVIFIKSVIR